MKKNICGVIVPVIALTFVMTTGIFAQEATETPKPKVVYGNVEAKESNYISVKATVLKVVFQDGMKRIMAKTEDGQLMAFNTYYYTPILQNDKKITAPSEGDLVTIAYKKNAPMTASEPPQVNADVVVVMDPAQSFSVEIDDFDATGLSKDGKKQLVLSESTVIEDMNGDAQGSEAIQNKALIVFYSVETSSMPKRIIAKSIRVIENAEPNRDQVALRSYYYDQLSEEAKYLDGAVTYVRVKDLANLLGVGMTWEGETQTVSLNKAGHEYQFRVGDKNYTNNQSSALFYHAPKIIGDKIFVELDFALQLIAAYS